MTPFYSSLCAELGREVDTELLSKMEAENKKELTRLEDVIEDAGKNFGETEKRDALLAKAEYFCKIGNKVCIHLCVWGGGGGGGGGYMCTYYKKEREEGGGKIVRCSV